MRYLPLRPRWDYFLRKGLPKPEGEDTHKLKRDAPTLGEAPEHFERGYEHESTKKLTWRLLVEAKSQGIWSREQVLAELLDPSNVGGRWLRFQDDPTGTFDLMWAAAVQHDPKWSVEQQTALALEAIEETPGIQLVRLLSLVGGNRGHLADLLTGLVAAGELREERTYGPSGTQVTSRRLWRVGKRPVAEAAKHVATAVSLTLLATSMAGAAVLTATSTSKVHRTSGTRPSYSFQEALTNKRMRARGIAAFLRMAAERRSRLSGSPLRRAKTGWGRDSRPRQPRQPELHRLSDPELDRLVVGLDL
jgi:hypothetical protein